MYQPVVRSGGHSAGVYFAWSLLDTFEWTKRDRPRCGLVYVDCPVQQRIVNE
ncbi:family 1 glycosylhydrolase [Larkinella bovis]|uniref:Family 1 glycosylhydrolase n=1 Tax=Larkinella bovis TaxID=683041 RepID=A0ABW0I3I6_9BACT